MLTPPPRTTVSEQVHRASNGDGTNNTQHHTPVPYGTIPCNTPYYTSSVPVKITRTIKCITALRHTAQDGNNKIPTVVIAAPVSTLTLVPILNVPYILSRTTLYVQSCHTKTSPHHTTFKSHTQSGPDSKALSPLTHDSKVQIPYPSKHHKGRKHTHSQWRQLAPYINTYLGANIYTYLLLSSPTQ